MVQYEWNDDKRRYNLEKHKADFIEGKLVYEHDDKITLLTQKNDEIRYMDIAPVNHRLMVLIYVIREDIVRIISFRKAHNPKEINLYTHLKMNEK